ncbi:hypothetical protein [Pelagibacterium lentulum]|uniref:Uncharacterized protein n=1 Tax=Pelagibacterium lentulum TaxID=2029865 RepID=A0A916RMJ8_9HYPH|nr:hypothetical protein [Pelagibacterium lentulum]GGA62164.1 hypothetical protein GCM10011499_35620 [Pelagibacterium lentulum]
MPKSDTQSVDFALVRQMLRAGEEHRTGIDRALLPARLTKAMKQYRTQLSQVVPPRQAARGSEPPAISRQEPYV